MSLFAGNQSPTNAPINYTGLNVGSSQWNAPVPIFWGMRRLSTNAAWFGNFSAKSEGGKGKGGGGKGDQQKTYTASVVLGLCEGPLDATDPVGNIWANGSTTTTTTLSAMNMVLALGTTEQAPWNYLVDNYPDAALAYSQLAYLGAINLGLGESATIPDNGFECKRTLDFAFVNSTHASGWINPNSHTQSLGVDCLMSDIIPDLLTNVQYGMSFNAGDLGDMTQYATYQRAQGIFFSPLLNSQEKCTEILDRWAMLSNAWIYWAGTAINFVPLGDSVVTGNGVTYTPDVDVAYDLDYDDFLPGSGKDDGPVKVTRIDPADAHNRTALDFTDRTLAYIDNPVEWKDDGLVDQYGLRDNSSTEADEICDPAVAKVVVQLLGKRNAYIRNTYTFKTSWRFILCVPGTILTLTEPNIGLDHVRVRVQKVSGDEKGQLSFICEEFPGNVGTYYPAVAAAAITAPTTPILNIPPGNVNTPAIIEPDSSFTAGTPQIIIAASGGVAWGGCTVNISFDGVNYSQIGVINASAKQGLLTSALAAYGGDNPDTADTLAVDCTESLTLPTPVSNDDATALRTLSLVAAQPTLVGDAYEVPNNGELLAFGSVTSTATYAANLTYLQRGAYGTAPGAHGVGDQFTLLDVTGTDGTSVAYDLPAQYIGQVLYLKLASFNVFGQASQDLSTVAEYQYTPTGAGFGGGTVGAPLEPTGFGLLGSPGATSVPLAWTANQSSDNVTRYTVWRAPGASAAFSSASEIWSGLALAYTDGAVAANTAYTYFLTANNSVGGSPNTAGVNATTSASMTGSTTLVTAASSPLSLGVAPGLTWYVDVNNTAGAPLQINLPTGAPVVGQRIVITDAGGNATTNAFTIKAGATTIDTVNISNGWSVVRWNGSAWLRSA